MSLEGLRGIASIVVVVGHFTFVFLPYLATIFYPYPGASPTYGIEIILRQPPFTLLFSADAAVSVFFVMSGYVLATRFISNGSMEGLKEAAAKRYVRLVLPAAASIIFAWFLLKWGLIITKHAAELDVAGWVPEWYRQQLSFPSALFNAFVGAPLFSQTGLNPPVWTIQVELIGSIFLFSMLALFERRPIQLVLWSTFFSILLSFQTPNALFYMSFIAGALLNHAVQGLQGRQGLSAVLFIIGLSAVSYNHARVFDIVRAIPLPSFQPYGPDMASKPRLVWHTIGSIALVAGVLGWRPASYWLSTRIPVYLGKISFAMYLIHMPLVMSVGLWTLKGGLAAGLSRGGAITLAYAAYLVCVVLLSSVFHRWIDVPSMALASKISKWRR